MSSSSSASASIEEFIEILNAEQHVDLQKLRDYARHGVQPGVRGEVWLYLLGVLSDDKSQEMTSVRSKYLEYDSLDKHNASLEKRIRNESARYYQRKLIARPPPGRTLARSSKRLSSRSYGTVRQYNSSGLLLQPASNGSASDASTKEAASLAQMEMNRGPNRVDTGQSRMLAGIMGSSSVLDSSSITSSEDEDLLMDPEAAAGSEMKRFCSAVEHVVCAHLNRWSLREGQRKSPESPSSTDRQTHDFKRLASPSKSFTANSPSSDQQSRDGYNSSSLSSQSGTSAMEDRSRDSGLDEALRTPRRLSSDSHSSKSSSSSSSSSSSTSDEASHITKQSSLQRSTGKEQNKSKSNLFPSLPREYQWAHQPAKISATSTLFTLDSVSLNGIQHTGQLVQPDYHPDLILLCSPFVKCIRVEAGMYFAFERLMRMREDYYAAHPLPWQISTFLTLFRTTLPELHAYFEEEEVDTIGLASAWLRHLLAAEMRIEDLMRLWDTYFAVPDPMDLHMYVCIAILTNCKDALEELDQSEAKSMLFSLPPLDVDRILNEAINIRLSHRQSEVFQGTR